MVQSTKRIMRVSFASAVALGLPSIVSADDIRLTFKDHGFTISGDCTAVTQTSYVVITEHGEMTVPIDMVTCEGKDCVAQTVTIAADS